MDYELLGGDERCGASAMHVATHAGDDRQSAPWWLLRGARGQPHIINQLTSSIHEDTI